MTVGGNVAAEPAYINTDGELRPWIVALDLLHKRRHVPAANIAIHRVVEVRAG